MAFFFRGHDFRCYLGYPHVDCNSSNLLFVSALFRPISICFRGTKYEVSELLRVENNLNKMAYLMFALRDVSQVSGFLEVV